MSDTVAGPGVSSESCWVCWTPWSGCGRRRGGPSYLSSTNLMGTDFSLCRADSVQACKQRFESRKKNITLKTSLKCRFFPPLVFLFPAQGLGRTQPFNDCQAGAPSPSTALQFTGESSPFQGMCPPNQATGPKQCLGPFWPQEKTFRKCTDAGQRATLHKDAKIITSRLQNCPISVTGH